MSKSAKSLVHSCLLLCWYATPKHPPSVCKISCPLLALAQCVKSATPCPYALPQDASFPEVTPEEIAAIVAGFNDPSQLAMVRVVCRRLLVPVCSWSPWHATSGGTTATTFQRSLQPALRV